MCIITYGKPCESRRCHGAAPAEFQLRQCAKARHELNQIVIGHGGVANLQRHQSLVHVFHGCALLLPDACAAQRNMCQCRKV